jgi:hypothetical protein
MKIAIRNLKSELRGPVALFVGTASFEDRCCTILEELRDECTSFLIFKNSQVGPHAEQNLHKMLTIVGERGVLVGLDLDEPMVTARSLRAVVDAASKGPEGSVFVDITTFTHEQLLILFRILEQEKPARKIIFGYTGASRYSVNTDPKDVWLSRGVSQVRSVLGFPGNLLPSKRLHLIVLVGFEHERAKAVIEMFEPSVLTLGVGEKSQSVSDEHFETNHRFFDDVRKFVDRRTSISADVNSFEFSCVDPQATKASVIEEIGKYPDYNTVICPMNTKLSTLGVALAASENPAVQVCYSRAIEYNEVGYSTASDQVTLFEMSFG